MAAATAYPLTWPNEFPRREAQRREQGAFKTALPKALKNVEDSIRLFGSDSRKPITGLVISSNVSLGRARPADPGVAVWFTWDGMGVCIAVDRYSTVEANLQAIHHILEARRVELRHGTLALVKATFRGFLALPAPAEKHWSEVLGVVRTATVDDVEKAFKRLLPLAHPDRGGTNEAMAELNVARDRAIADISAGRA
jgi:hypothetical protein